MFKEREKIRLHLSPFKSSLKTQLGSDILTKTWEAFATNPSKVFNLDTVLLSPSRSTIVELVKQINASGRQFDYLPQVNLSEFKDTAYLYSLENCAKAEFCRERMRRYRSPFVLNTALPIKDKYESILAVDVAMALIHTFKDEHKMLSHNLLNMYLSEELKEAAPSVILAAVYSLVVEAKRPHIDATVYYAVLMNSMVYNSKAMENFKKFKGLSEDVFVQSIFSNIAHFAPAARTRAISFLSFFLSQIAGKDLGQAEPILLKLTTG